MSTQGNQQVAPRVSRLDWARDNEPTTPSESASQADPGAASPRPPVKRVAKHPQTFHVNPISSPRIHVEHTSTTNVLAPSLIIYAVPDLGPIILRSPRINPPSHSACGSVQ